MTCTKDTKCDISVTSASSLSGHKPEVLFSMGPKTAMRVKPSVDQHAITITVSTAPKTPA